MPFKSTLFKSFFVFFLIGTVVLLCMIAIPVAFVIFGLESTPMVAAGKKLTLEDVKRIKEMIRENDPRMLKDGEITKFSFAERDLNLLLYYGLSHSPLAEKLNSRIHLNQNSAKVLLTYNLPNNPFGRYLNVSALLIESSGDIPVFIKKLKIGGLGIPGWLINPMWQYAQRYFQRYEAYEGVIEGFKNIENVRLEKGEMFLVYKWQKEVSVKIQKQGRDMLLPVEERKRLLAYNEQLKKIVRAIDKKSISLTDLLRPMFQIAKERTAAGGDPAAENRALILTTTIYALGRDLDRVVGRPRPVGGLTISGQESRDEGINGKEIKPQQQPNRVILTLRGRNDLALHFLVSAAITVSAGGGMADFMGLFKEMDDSRGGSGFSFADLAADRAGVKLANAGTGSSFSANLLQQQMSEQLKESDFMPRVDHLPEGIMELEFKKKYKDLDSATYRIVDEEIERRIVACRVYRE